MTKILTALLLAGAWTAQAQPAPEVLTSSSTDAPAAAAPAEPAAPPKAEEPAKEAPKPEPAAEAPAAAPAADPLQAQWTFLKKEISDPDIDPADLAARLEAFDQERPPAEVSSAAQAALANAEQKSGDWRAALVRRLHLVYEYPDAQSSLEAKSAYLELANNKLSRSLRQEAASLLRLPDGSEASDRLAVLVQRLSGPLADSLRGAALDEARRFLIRYPGHVKTAEVLWAYGQMQEQSKDWTGALLSDRELLAVCPDSPLRPKAQFAVGVLYGERLKRYDAAIQAYQEIVDKYSSSPEALAAYQKMAELFARRLKQYPLAVEMDQKLVAAAPKTPAALDALHDAADIARSDLEDYNLEIKLLDQIASDFPQSKDGPEALYEAAQVYEDKLKDLAKAIAAYQDVVSKFPESKQAKKAAARVEKLQPAKT